MEKRSIDPYPRECTNESGAAYVALRREVTERMCALLELAMNAFEERKFQNCTKLCREMLIIIPFYRVAEELLADSQKAAARPEYASYLQRNFDEWNLFVSEEEPVLPYSHECRFPSREEWEDYSQRVWSGVAGPIRIPKRVTLAGTDLDLYQWIDNLMSSDVPVHLKGSPLRHERMTLHVGEVPVEYALDLIAARFGLTWSRNETGFVLLSTP